MHRFQFQIQDKKNSTSLIAEGFVQPCLRRNRVGTVGAPSPKPLTHSSDALLYSVPILKSIYFHFSTDDMV